MTKFCIEEATINDMSDYSTFITTFRNMKGSATATRNTADAAFLLTQSMGGGACGVGYMSAYASGWTISIGTKSCALGYYTFGHELGKGSICKTIEIDGVRLK